MALESFDLVPSKEVRGDLAAAMGKMIRDHGFEMFACEPIYLPCNEHFPEPLKATRGSILNLLRRLMAYSLLDDLEVELEVYDSAHPYDELTADGRWVRPPLHAAAWYGGEHGGRCHFGLDVKQLNDVEKLAGVLCHEVAHAYRDHHRLVVVTTAVEEMLTDLTTVYLGFGVFTANNAYRYRSEGRTTGFQTQHMWREEKIGYLSPQALTFLLALQAVARGPRVEKRVARDLEPTQRAMFDEARVVIGDEPELLDELGLPPRSDWPSPTSARKVAQAVTASLIHEDDDEELVFEELAEPHESSDHTVFRARDKFPRFAIAIAVFGSLAVSPWVVNSLEGLVLMSGATAFVAYQVGNRCRRLRCSDPDCAALLSADATRCHGCGGKLEPP